MGKLTVVSVMGASILGLALFHMKHVVEKQERKLKDTTQQVGQVKESLHVLKAEWSYLNEPQRLQKLNEKHLKLEPLDPSQVVSLPSIPFTVSPSLEKPEKVRGPHEN
jgi:hypothetical protein